MVSGQSSVVRYAPLSIATRTDDEHKSAGDGEGSGVRQVAQLSDKAREFLNEQRFATLATINRDGTPHQTVMWYELQGDAIMMNTARGRLKDSNLLRDARISICVEDGYRFVTCVGVAELNDDQEVAQADIARLAARYHTPERAAAMKANFAKEERVTIRMAIARVLERGLT